MSNQPPPPPPGYDAASSDNQSWAPNESSGPSHHHQQGDQHDLGQPGAPVGTLSESEEKTWSILAHLSAPIAALISVGMLNFLGPLIIWVIYKDKSPRVRHAAAGAFNFNLSLWILYAVLVFASVLTLGIGLLITIPVGILVWIGSMVIHVMAAIKANNGEVYTYPMQIPVLK